MTNLNHCFDVIALTETWSDIGQRKTRQLDELEGYNPFVLTYGNSLKGGCGFFVRNGIHAIERKDLDIAHIDNTSEYEAKWIEIVNNKSKNILIGVCYRHPRKQDKIIYRIYNKHY